MPMVRIGHVGMGVFQRAVAVPVAVRTSRHWVMAVRVVVIVMGVRVLVLQRFMPVAVFVPLSQVQHHAANHEHAAQAHQP